MKTRGETDQAILTFILFRDGQERGRLIGVRSGKEAIARAIEAHLSAASN